MQMSTLANMVGYFNLFLTRLLGRYVRFKHLITLMLSENTLKYLIHRILCAFAFNFLVEKACYLNWIILTHAHINSFVQLPSWLYDGEQTDCCVTQETALSVPTAPMAATGTIRELLLKFFNLLHSLKYVIYIFLKCNIFPPPQLHFH